MLKKVLVTLIMFLVLGFVVNDFASANNGRDKTVIDNNGELVDAYKKYGKSKMVELTKKQNTFKYLSNFEILENINNVSKLKSLNEKNKKAFIIYDYDLKEIDGYKTYGEYRMYLLKDGIDKFKYISNYDFLENYWLDGLVQEINNFNSKKYKVINRQLKEIDGFEIFGQYKMTKFMQIKHQYPSLDNYSILIDINNPNILKQYDEIFSQTFRVSDENGIILDGFEKYGEEHLSFLIKYQNKYAFLTNYQIVENMNDFKKLDELNEKNKKIEQSKKY